MTGITVTLYERAQTGVDALNDPIYTETPVEVPNVLVGQPTTDDVTSSINLYGKKLEFMLGIPKGDTHNWKDVTVEFFGQRFRTFGAVMEGISANVPTPWLKKVRAELYE